MKKKETNYYVEANVKNTEKQSQGIGNRYDDTKKKKNQTNIPLFWDDFIIVDKHSCNVN